MHEEQPQKHEMVLRSPTGSQSTDESGAEEWYCPICGRRFLLQLPPGYKKIVLEPGDEYASHSGSKGGLKGRSALDMTDDPGLLPWKEWMKKADFRSLWDKDL